MPKRLSPLVLPILAVLVLLTWTVSAPEAAGTALSAQVREEIRAELSRARPPRLNLGRPVPLTERLLPDFYRQRDYRPAWIDDFGLTSGARVLVDALRGAGEEGLCPEDYHLQYLEPLLRLEADYLPHGILFDSTYMAHLDLLLSDAFFRYGSDLIRGRVDPQELLQGWHLQPRQDDLVRLLGAAVEELDVATVLESLLPLHDGYRRLRGVLEDYRRIAALGGWPTIPPGPVLRKGRDERLPLLRERLRLGGDLELAAGEGGDFFDVATRQALIRFQARHGLTPDGVLGEQTRAALNVSVERRLRQIEINLERWRWMRHDLGRRHILVNIADFSLQVVEDGRRVMSMPVVVGTSYRKTPVFSARMTYLQFAPYWTVPSTILREDKLPLIKKDPRWLARHGYEIVARGTKADAIDPAGIDWQRVEAKNFPGYLRMNPGPRNPLGRVKFMFPNRFAVYLHDTPDRYLFSRDVRSFSSGCIRVERPMDLAQHLLADDPNWDCDLILRALESREPLTVHLPASWPVHILYWTAWVDEEGTLQLRDDFYLRDLDVEVALMRASQGDDVATGLLTAGF